MPTDKLTIWQQNMNKLPNCQHTLVSNNILTKHEIDIVVLQELAVNRFNQSIASKDWVLVYLSTHCAHPKKTCTLMLVSVNISTDNWEQMDFPSEDITIVVIKGMWGRITIINIYNDGNNNKMINQLKPFHRTKLDTGNQSKERTAHTMWLGDFNHHHPHWDDPSNTRLFTEEALKAVEVLIEVVASVTGQLAGGQENCWDGGMSAFDPQDW